MSKPVIFTISAAWDAEASVWSGHCDDIPAAADAPTLHELLAKISAMALDLLPDNHPGVLPDQLFLHITAMREAVAAEGGDRAEWCDLMAAQATSMEAVWSHSKDHVWDKV
jgi:hypothetical protein